METNQESLENQGSTGEVLTPQKTVSRGVFFSSLIVVACVAGVGGFLIGGLFLSDRQPAAPITTPPTATVSSSSPTTSLLPASAAPSPSGSAIPVGWVMYESPELGVRFAYPPDSLEVRSSTSNGFQLHLYSKKSINLGGNSVEVLNLSSVYAPLTYGDVNTPLSIDTGAVSIDGKSYDVWRFLLGEGGPCGGGGVETWLIKVNDALFVSKLRHTSSSNKDRANCTSAEFDEFATPDSELQLADQVIRTITTLR